ncbi:hypothetical protein [Aestuariirhabdus sp. LZHN29]|uniref:hypothetical protein n=1 Tax=Aestuariirhabdus sp. LZHN29 TaxID=3417462 RepID=UPI003CF3F819
MAKKDPADDKALLDELMSIRQLLDDELQGEQSPTDNIPILNEVDNGEPAVIPPAPKAAPRATDLYKARAESAYEKNIQRGSSLLKPLTRDMLGDNPFLPKQTLAKLNSQKSLQQVEPVPDQGAKDDASLTEQLNTLEPEQQTQAIALLESKGEQIIQQLVEDTLPRLEVELRQRLRQQLNTILNQFDKQ